MRPRPSNGHCYAAIVVKPQQRALLGLGLTLLLAPSSARLLAAPPRLVGDYNAGTTPNSGGSQFVDLGDSTTYFGLDTAAQGAIWRSDGTAHGTRVAGVIGAAYGGFTYGLGHLGPYAFYQSVDDAGVGVVVWRTDGTPAGTLPLTPPMTYPFTGTKAPAAAGEDHFYFAGCLSPSSCAIWSTDGTQEGTTPWDLEPGTRPVNVLDVTALANRALVLVQRFPDRSELVSVDSRGRSEVLAAFPSHPRKPSPSLLTTFLDSVLFLAPTGSTGRLQLWRTDGHVRGTRPLSNFPGKHAFDLTAFLKPIGGRAYFIAASGGPPQLWTTDGTAAGTISLTQFQTANPFSERNALGGYDVPHADALESVGGVVVFTADDGRHGPALWTTRGTSASTQLLTGCLGGCPTADATYFAHAGDRLVFAASDAQHGRQLWVTDGRAAGTHMLKKIVAGIFAGSWLRFFTPAGRFVVFQRFYGEYDGGDLWVTDGTPAGTILLGPGGPGDSHYHPYPAQLRLDVGAPPGRVLVQTDTSLVTSDGTVAGTTPLIMGLFGASSYPTNFAWLGSTLIADLCRDGEVQIAALRGDGAERLDGAPLLYCQESSFGTPAILTVGERAVFLSLDPQHPAIYGTDGTAIGTHLLTAPEEPVVGPFPSARWGATFLSYTAGYPGTPMTLWRTDGTASGTLPLMEFPPDLLTNRLFESNGRVFFQGNEVAEAVERVWVSDGTATGTIPLQRTPASYGQSVDPRFFTFRSLVYFLAPLPNGALALWKSDGTPSGTRPAVTPAAGVRLDAYTPIAVAGGRIYFAASSEEDPHGPLRPWVSDGTQAGTRLLAHVSYPNSFYWMPSFVEANGRVFFAAADTLHGNELWVTDGTPGGTRMLADIQRGIGGSDPRWLTAVGDSLVFVAQNEGSGAELRVVLPGETKPRLVADVAPGPSWSDPLNLLWDDERQLLVFSADDGAHGREPWSWAPFEP